MALGNIFDEEASCSDRLIFVDKDAKVKCYHNDIAELTELAVCGGLTMNEARQAVQCLVNS